MATKGPMALEAPIELLPGARNGSGSGSGSGSGTASATELGTPSTANCSTADLDHTRLEDAIDSPTQWPYRAEFPQLPPVDGGKDAWLFLAACFVLEVFVWGR